MLTFIVKAFRVLPGKAFLVAHLGKGKLHRLTLPIEPYVKVSLHTALTILLIERGSISHDSFQLMQITSLTTPSHQAIQLW